MPSERASERWLREHISTHVANMEDEMRALCARYAPEVARIDAAEARFEAVKFPKKAACVFLLTPCEWSITPDWWEALADVAEGIDRRASGEPTDKHPVGCLCDRCVTAENMDQQIDAALRRTRERAEGGEGM